MIGEADGLLALAKRLPSSTSAKARERAKKTLRAVQLWVQRGISGSCSRCTFKDSTPRSSCAATFPWSTPHTCGKIFSNMFSRVTQCYLSGLEQLSNAKGRHPSTSEDAEFVESLVDRLNTAVNKIEAAFPKNQVTDTKAFWPLFYSRVVKAGCRALDAFMTAKNE